MEREGFKLLSEHRDECLAEKSEFGTFVLHDGYEWRRKRNGHRGGTTMWHRFRCNDTDCEAVMMVRDDVLVNFVDGRP